MTRASVFAARHRVLLAATLIIAAAATACVVLQAPHALSADVGPDGAITAADGRVDPGSSLSLYDRSPAVAGLDGRLLDALREAADVAADEGVELLVNSGWRSAELQARMLRDAVTRYGSLEEAQRWVATADESEHVRGEAADIGPSGAAEWLGHNGERFGLCQIYENEAWHFELRPDAALTGCPQMYRDATQRER